MCYGEADVVFAVDVSGSIRENRFSMMKEWLSLVVENLEISGDKTRVALLTFRWFKAGSLIITSLTSRSQSARTHLGRTLSGLTYLGISRLSLI